jgi:hypothetical protein
MFLRFVVGTDADNAFRLDGVFTEAASLRNAGELDRYESQWLQAIFDWFHVHLPCPPFRKMQRAGAWTRNAVCWFRDDAGEPLNRIWDIVALIEHHGVPVRLLRARRPGTIVYRDEYQIVAELYPRG